MNIEVRVFAGLQRYIAGAESGVPVPVDMPEGATGLDLINKLGIPEAEAFVFMINGCRAELDDVVKEGDRVGIFPPVGGG